MRIGFDAKRAFSNNTGLGNYSRYTINALCRIFPENEYLLYTPTRGDKNSYGPPDNSFVCLPDTIWSNQLKSYWRTYGLNRRLIRDNVQLYHGLSNELPVGIENCGVRSVVTIHDLIFMRFPGMYKAIDRSIYRKKTVNALKSANRIIAISNQTKNDMIELLNADETKIRVVYQGCNPWFYEKVSEEKQLEIQKRYSLPGIFLLYVGTIEERKNLLEIIRAVHEHAIDIPLLAIGGKTAYFEKVKKYIDQHKVRNIHIRHHIANSDLPAIYQQAEAFIYPSSYEGFGIPVLEALNSGIPVITSSGGCLEETAGPGGLFVTPRQSEEIAFAINKLLADSKLKDKLVKEGYLHALNFREEKTIPQLEAVYKECLK